MVGGATTIREMILAGHLTERPGRYLPKTAVAAMRAHRTGILPIEVFLNLSTSAKPLNVAPYDLEKIRELLSRYDLDIESVLLLMGIFRVLVNDKDPEIALFAAESINLLEGRYTTRIEELRQATKGSTDRAATLELARLYFQLGLLYEDSPAIKAFYLNEAYRALRAVKYLRNLERDDFILLVRILASLGREGLALSLLKNRSTEDPSYLIYQLEIEFYRRNYTQVFLLLSELNERSVELELDVRELMEYWMKP